MSSSGGTAQASSACRFQSGRSIRSAPSRCSASNKNTESGTAGRRVLAGGAGRGVLERQRPAVLAQRDQLAVQHRRPDRQLAQRRDHLGQPAGDVVQGPGEQADLPLGQVGLDPDPVELPLHRGLATGPAADLGQGLVDARRAGREHRPHRAARPPGRRRPAPRSRRPAPRPPPRPASRAASSPGGPPPPAPKPPGPRPRSSPPPARPAAARRTAARTGTAARPGWPGRTARRPAPCARPPNPSRPPPRSRRTPRPPRPISVGTAAGGNPSRSAAHPTPICRCGSSPDRYATAIGTSSGPAWRSAPASVRSWPAGRRSRPRPATPQRSRASSTRPFCPTGSPP